MALADQQRKTRTELVAQRTNRGQDPCRPAGRKSHRRGRAPRGRCRLGSDPLPRHAARCR
jgi:hypothetical protein